jgi:hypothetical protein
MAHRVATSRGKMGVDALMSRRRLSFFISYSRRDEWLLPELQIHLEPLKQRHDITIWYDGRILAGADFGQEIARQMEMADVIIPLLSPDFLASPYCYEIEMTRARERHIACEALLQPVILRPCYWENTFFKDLQVLPKNGKPIIQWGNRDEAFLDVAKGIQKGIDAFLLGNHPMLDQLVEVATIRASSKIAARKTIRRVKSLPGD